VLDSEESGFSRATADHDGHCAKHTNWLKRAPELAGTFGIGRKRRGEMAFRRCGLAIPAIWQY
jgi:hypothetical protein